MRSELASYPNADRFVEMNDVALVSAIAAGEPLALATLYDRHHLPTLAVLERIMHEPAQAEDLLHDVFLEVWHHAATYDPNRGSVRTWIIIRARSRALDRLKKLMRDTELINQAHAEGRMPVATNPDDSNGLDGARVRYRMARLANDLQEVIELAYFEGLSSSEIAQYLQVPLGTVKSRMARALSSLRVAFGIEWGLEP